MNPMILIKTKGRLRPGAHAQFFSAIPRYVASARCAEGCLTFEYHTPAAEPDVVETIETWASPLAAMQHLIAPHTRNFHKVAAECLLAPPDITTLEWRE